jgi:hypothetical protein
LSTAGKDADNDHLSQRPSAEKSETIDAMTAIRPKPLIAVVLAIATGLPAAAAETNTAPSSRQVPGGVQELLRGIRGMRCLPVAGMQMVDAGERVLFVSDNGRYVFTGPAWDLCGTGRSSRRWRRAPALPTAST